MRKRSTRDAAVIWLVLAGLYLLFSGSVSAEEVAVGAVCASLGTLWWWGAGRRGDVRFRFGDGALRPLGTAVAGLPRQTVRVGLRLARILAGAEGGSVGERPASDVAWAAPAGDTASAARAVGLVAASLAPDSYVLRLDREHGTVALHALDPARP